MTKKGLKYYVTSSDGFTLIETLVAMVIFVIGVLALYSMQTTSIRYNAAANAITTSSVWATDQVEKLLALDYDDTLLEDSNLPTGLAGLNEVNTPDGQAMSPDGLYTIFWNIADYITPNPSSPADSTLKAIRIIVQHNDFGITKQTILNYYKQKIF